MFVCMYVRTLVHICVGTCRITICTHDWIQAHCNWIHTHIHTRGRFWPTSRSQARRSTTVSATCTATAFCYGRSTIAGACVCVCVCVCMWHTPYGCRCDVYSYGILLWKINYSRFLHVLYVCVCVCVCVWPTARERERERERYNILSPLSVYVQDFLVLDLA